MIQRANLDGSGVEDLVTGLDWPQQPRAIALYLPMSLTVNKDGGGSGTVISYPAGINCGADCTEDYDQGAVVTLKALAERGSFLVGWSGDCFGTNITTQVTVDAGKTCTATFGYPVGGIAVPLNKLGLAVPWMGLAALASLAALGVALVRRRRV